MAKSNADHSDQAVHNQKLLESIEKNLGKDFLDWRITVIFYVCVHCVDAKLAQLSLKAHSHIERNALVAWKLADISVDYMLLYTESINARSKPEYRKSVDETRIEEFEKIMVAVKAIVPIKP